MQQEYEKKQVEIIPTVMPDNFADLLEKIEQVFRYVKTIQIDVMDGVFVSSVSWPYTSKSDLNWERILKQEDGIPHWDKVDFEVDLMVKNQIQEANNWIDAGVCRIIGHYEAFYLNKCTEEAEKDLEEFLKLKTERGVEVYLAIAPDTENLVLNKYLERLDGVQFMGIKKVGYQGQPFAENVLEKISSLRKMKPEIQIAIDGGVNFETIEKLLKVGVNKLSCGSVIFKSNNIQATIQELNGI